MARKSNPLTRKKVSTKRSSKPVVVKKKKKKSVPKPPRSDECGLNIAVARAKTILDIDTMNRERSHALREIREAIKTNSSCDQMSQTTRDTIDAAVDQHHNSFREDLDRQIVQRMEEKDRVVFLSARKKAKSEFDRNARETFQDDRLVFNTKQFNLAQDEKFYNGHEQTLPDPHQDETELHVLARIVSKWKIRFSAHAKIIFTAFVDHVVRQMATNGIFCCVADGKKIVTVRNVVDITKEGLLARFPLVPLVQNLVVHRNRVVSVEKLEDIVKDGNRFRAKLDPSVQNLSVFDHKYEDDEDEEGEKKKHFNLYIGECFKAIRNEMSDPDGPFPDVDDETRAIYAQSSISRPLRKFCSDSIIEILQTLAVMLQTELHDKRVKTVTNRMLRTVIQHMHTVNSVDYEPTREFISGASAKYLAYVKERREKKKLDAKDQPELKAMNRKKIKKSKNDDEGPSEDSDSEDPDDDN